MSKPAIITAAIVGAEVTRAQTPYLPITPEEIALEAKRCVMAGASIIHLHVRGPDGRATQSAARFKEAIEAIGAETDVIIQTSTGGAVGMSSDERLQPLQCSPDMATLNCGTANFGDEIFENSLPMMRDFARAIRAAGVTPELELYDIGHIDNAMLLVQEGLLSAPLHFQFVLGIKGAAGARESVLRFLVSELPQLEHSWGVAAVGRHQLPMAKLGAELGGNIRVGLEDNIYASKGVLAKGSYELVEQAVRIAAAAGRNVASVAEARALLRLH